MHVPESHSKCIFLSSIPSSALSQMDQGVYPYACWIWKALLLTVVSSQAHFTQLDKFDEFGMLERQRGIFSLRLAMLCMKLGVRCLHPFSERFTAEWGGLGKVM